MFNRMYDETSFHLGQDGDAAVRALLTRLDLSLEPDVDLDEFERELQEGLEMIASFYPQVSTHQVDGAIRETVYAMLEGVGIVGWGYV